MEQSRANGNETETSSCTKMRGGNIQHEEANAVGYSNATDDGPEAKQVETDAATICVNASVNCEELEQIKEHDGWIYLDKI